MSSISLTDLSQYTLYFRGNDRLHGKFIPPDTVNGKGQKVNGKSFTVQESVNQDKYREHLEGKVGLGIVPIDDNNNVRFGVIDVDDYTLDPSGYQQLINEFELPFSIFKSKSGGLHIYVFFSEDVKAAKALDLLKRWVSIFGLPHKTEVFPKQKRLREGASGNWINLPYFGDSRKMLNADCKEIPLSEAIREIKNKLVNLSAITEAYEAMPLADGPPCLQSLYSKNDTPLAEMYLFNLAIYYKNKFPNEWQDYVYVANNRLEDPMPERRVEAQVISANEKNSYTYKCKEEPIVSRCDKALCATRQFGIGGDEVSNISFEKLTQIMSDPPHYEWVVNGAKMLFYSETELRNQERFADYCMRFLHMVPNRLKPVKWNAILNKAFTEIDQKKMDIKDDMSPGAILADYFYEFVCERAMAKNKMQLYNMGRVYFEEKKGMYYFRKSDLTHFIVHQKNFRYFGVTEIQDRLRRMGAGPDRIYISSKLNSVRVWSVTKDNMEKISDGSGVIEDQIDFSEYKEDNF